MGAPSADLMARWRTGDQQAAEQLFRRYLHRLLALARRRMSSWLARRLDAEDVVQSAYRTFFAGALAGRYSLQRNGDLWRLLSAITIHKIQRQVERNTAGKRAAIRERHFGNESSLFALQSQAWTREPTPQQAAALTDTLEEVFRGLDALERRMVELRLQGSGLEEIAADVRRSERTVRRVLERVKDRLRKNARRAWVCECGRAPVMPERRHTSLHSPLAGDDLDRLVDRFETAWQSGTPPEIEQFLPPGAVAARPLCHELVKIDLEYRWRRPPRGAAGRDKEGASRPRLEFYVKRIPRLGPLQQLPVDLIGEEYRVRHCWGDRPAHAEYAARFPDRGAALRAELARIDAELQAELATHCVRGAAGPVATERTHLRATAAPPPKRKVGRYELGDLLGTGAFGSVWQAWDDELGRQVAVKLPRDGPLWDPRDEERFLREARAAGQLHHPGIVAVYDVGRASEGVFIVSELIQGENLAERLRRGRPSFQETAELTAHAADALDYAHRQGVVHRDVKPSNIMLTREETPAPKGSSVLACRRPLLTDFGLALDAAADFAMTMDGQVLGTPAYMSPEQIRNPHAVDGRSDIYSLGVVLYELLTGELPFHGLARTLLARTTSEPPRPPRQVNDRVPRDLETVCLKCLTKEPARRYPTAGASAVDLRRWLAGEPIFARRVGRPERAWLRVKRNRTMVIIGGLGATALAAATGAPVVAALVAVAAGSLLLALHNAQAASESAQAVEELKRQQQKDAASLQFVARHCTLAREDQQRAVAAETRARRQLVPSRELARALLFDLPEKWKLSPCTAPAKAFLIQTVLAYLDGLKKEAEDDAALLRELAVAYAKISDVQGSASGGAVGDLVGALASRRKSLEIFRLLADLLPDNAQAQRDLGVSVDRTADLEQAIRQSRRVGEARAGI